MGFEFSKFYNILLLPKYFDKFARSNQVTQIPLHKLPINYYIDKMIIALVQKCSDAYKLSPVIKNRRLFTWLPLVCSGVNIAMLFDQFICFWRSTPTKRKYLSFRTIFRSLYFITSSACNTFALPSVKTLLERFLLPVYSRKHGANNLPKLRAASRFVSQIYQIQWTQRTNKTNLLEINTHFFKASAN